MFFGSQESLVGLDIGSASIKILQLKKSKGKHKVERFGIKALPAETIVDGSIMDGLEVVSAIKEISAEQRLKQKNVALSISGTSVIVKKISLPPMAEEDLEKQIKFEAEQYIPFDINDVYLDFHILNGEEHLAEGQQEMSVLLVATKKDKLNDYANAVREAGLIPKVVDVDAFAIENMYCVNYETLPGELTALVNIGASVMNINILKGGSSAFTRDITIGETGIPNGFNKTWAYPSRKLKMQKRARRTVRMRPRLVPLLPRSIWRSPARSAVPLITSGRHHHMTISPAL